MDRASFEVLEAEFVAIVGPSGCGKSVSLGAIGSVMALGIKQAERRLLRWRPEYRTERA